MVKIFISWDCFHGTRYLLTGITSVGIRNPVLLDYFHYDRNKKSYAAEVVHLLADFA